MKLVNRFQSHFVTAAFAAAILVVSASAASAFGPRIPQVALNPASLQGYLNANDGGINVLTDQVDAQVWKSSVSGNATFTLMIELAGNATANAIGVYNSADPPNPPLFQIFPGAATAGWFATCHFGPGGSLTVLLYDQNAVSQGSTGYAGVNRNSFGFYLDGPGGRFYSQDSRNGGNAQILTYLGTDANFGDWWECFEDLPWNQGDNDFDDAVLLLQSVAPTPVSAHTWGALKALYR
jgi:hypothetical protein